MNRDRLNQIKAALDKAIPDGWRTNLTTRDRYVVLTVEAAPVDLVALDAVPHPTDSPRRFVKINPLPYETPWDDASAAIIAIWRALHTGNTVQFDRRGDRTGAFHFVEMWVGTPGKPFVVTV